MKYDVHIYAIVRVKRVGIEAESQEEAMTKAEGLTDFRVIFDNHGDGDLSCEYADDIDCFHVDEEGDTQYLKSRWYDKDYKPL